MSRTLKLSTNAFNTSVFLPVKISGSERINELFRYSVIVKTPDLDGINLFKSHGDVNPASADVTAWIGQNLSVAVEIDHNGIIGDTRWISGQITSARYLYQQRKSHFYAIEISPFLSFANLRSDYKIFQDKTVVEILDEILALYPGSIEKRLDESRYPKRVYQTQFGETDFAFFERLCSEWSINYFFTHSSTGHILVLNDEASGHQVMPNAAYQSIDYYPPDSFVTDKQEVINDISLIASAVSGAFSSKDYDYQQPAAVVSNEASNIQPYPEASSSSDKKENKETPEIALAGHQVYEYAADVTQAQKNIKATTESSESTSNDENASSGSGYGEEHTLRDTWNLERLQQSHFKAMATGHVRGLSCGYTFKLNKHPNQLANIDWNVVGTELMILDMREESHRKASGLSSLLSSAGAGESNISKGFLEQITEQINSSLSEKIDQLKKEGLDSLDRLLTGDDQTWQIECKAELIPANIVVRPSKKDKPRGTLQNALVVGSGDADSIHTDELGRIKVQFYWDRYGQKDEHSSCWVRVNEPWAGNQMGAVFTPRIGQEVLVDYINNDPDLPVCIGKVNNSDNLPNWKLTENKTLSGFRSREVPAGNSSSGRSNHLVFDDTAGNIQTQLKSDHAHSQLSLGDITRIEGHGGRSEPRGKGFELRTDEWGAIRSTKGLYMTTYDRESALGHTMDAKEAVRILDKSKELTQELSENAEKHNAEKLAGLEELNKFLENNLKTLYDKVKNLEKQVAGMNAAGGGGNAEGEEKETDKFDEAAIIISGPKSIALTTPESIYTHSDHDTHMVTRGNQNFAVGKNFLASISEKLSLYAQLGVKLFSGNEKVEIQAQNNEIDVIAKKDVNISSTEDWVRINAPKGILLNSGGSYLKITPSGIEHGTGSAFTVYSASHTFTGPKTMSQSFQEMPVTKFSDEYTLLHEVTKEPLADYKVSVTRADGSIMELVTDAQGKIKLMKSEFPEKVKMVIKGKIKK